MKYLNLNTLHNILNFAIAVLAALVGLDWSGVVSPEVALKIIAGLSTAKIYLNIARDGLTGIIKVQPPVKQ